MINLERSFIEWSMACGEMVLTGYDCLTRAYHDRREMVNEIKEHLANCTIYLDWALHIRH